MPKLADISRDGIPVVATYHPSPVSLNRQPGRRETVLKDLSLVRRKLEGPAESSCPRWRPR